MNTLRLLKLLVTAFFVVALAMGSAIAKDKKENPFPNATRKEPKAATSTVYEKIKKGYDALDAGEDEDAKAQFQAVLDHKRSTPYEKGLAYQGLAQLAYNADDVDGAIKLDQQAIELDSLDNVSHFGLIYQVAQLNLMQENYQGTLDAIEKWNKLSGQESADSLAVKGNALYRLERFPEAAEAIKKAIALSPEPNDTWYQILIASYYDAEKYDEAGKVGEEILAKDPNNKKLILQLASIYLEQEQNDKALTMLESAYSRGLLTEHDEIRQLYQMYNFLEKPQQAAQVINDGLAKGVLKPDLETYKGLGDSYALAADAAADESPERKAMFAKAIEAWGKAAPFAKDGEIDFQRGQLLIQETDQLAEGKKAMEAAIAKGGLKREGEAYILLGNAEMELGNLKAAIAAFQKARNYPSTKQMAESWLKSAQQR